jgi:hypothetical protein
MGCFYTTESSSDDLRTVSRGEDLMKPRVSRVIALGTYSSVFLLQTLKKRHLQNILPKNFKEKYWLEICLLE